MCTGCWLVSTDIEVVSSGSYLEDCGLSKWGGGREIKRKGRETDIMLMCRRESLLQGLWKLETLRGLEVLSPCSFLKQKFYLFVALVT